MTRQCGDHGGIEGLLGAFTIASDEKNTAATSCLAFQSHALDVTGIW
jgi:hypothetical protein